MAEVTEPQDVLYQPGISFRNPRLARPATRDRSRQWFTEQTMPGPLTAKSKLKKWEVNPHLKEYKAVWNRAAKQRNVEKLGAYFHDVPSFASLGAAPSATSETQTVVRGPLGFLDNAISLLNQGAGGVFTSLTQREVQKTQSALAQTQAFRLPFTGGDSSLFWILGAVGVIGVGAYLYMRK